jgi:hypothetical protein
MTEDHSLRPRVPPKVQLLIPLFYDDTYGSVVPVATTVFVYPPEPLFFYSTFPVVLCDKRINAYFALTDGPEAVQSWLEAIISKTVSLLPYSGVCPSWSDAPVLYADAASAGRAAILAALAGRGVGAFWPDGADQLRWTDPAFDPYPRLPAGPPPAGDYAPVAFARSGLAALLRPGAPDVSEFAFAALIALQAPGFEELLRGQPFDARLEKYVDRLVFFRFFLAQPVGRLRFRAQRLRSVPASADEFIDLAFAAAPRQWTVVYCGAGIEGMTAVIGDPGRPLLRLFGPQPPEYRMQSHFVDRVARLVSPRGGRLLVRGIRSSAVAAPEIPFDIYVE